MADIEISGLPPTSGIADNDLVVTKKGTSDLRATVAQLADAVLDKLTDQDIFDAVKRLDGATSGLSSQYLGGQDKSFYQNASNLITGLIASNLLPQGSFGVSNTSSHSRVWVRFPEFISGMRFMIQFGYTQYVPSNSRVTVTFPQVFASGLTSENRPLIIGSPQCRSGEAQSSPAFDVELDMRVHGTPTLSGFTASSIRTSGSKNDTVRLNYIALGRY